MARPMKKGLEYFSIDVDMLHRMKIRKIMRSCGPQSIAVLIDLLGNIYGDDGYYMKWDDDACFLIFDDVGVKEAPVQEIVNKAIQVDFFDKDMFDKYSILTSRGIQDRYKEASKKRKNNGINPKYLLVDGVSAEETGVNDTETRVSGSDNQQSKVKESKVNKSKVNKSHSAKPNYSPDSDPYQIAKHLLERIRANNADFKPSFGEKDLQRWANDIRLAHDRDKREYSQLYRMVDWCQSNTFWQSNILSGAKLRAKYDTMAAQANASRGVHGNGRKEIIPEWAKRDVGQTDSKPSSGNQLTDAQRKQLAERIAKLATSNEEV